VKGEVRKMLTAERGEMDRNVSLSEVLETDGVRGGSRVIYKEKESGDGTVPCPGREGKTK